jgi:hypothetical protein
LPGDVEAFLGFVELLTAALPVGILEESVYVLEDGSQIFGGAIGGQGLEEGGVVGVDLPVVTVQSQAALVKGGDFFF